MSDAEQLLAPDVICHMDRYTVRGTDVWYDWLEFIRSRIPDRLSVEVERYVTGPDGIIRAYGCLRRGTPATATPCRGVVKYRVENGRVAEIWTSRGNYEIIFGARVRHSLSWLLVLVQMAVWRRLPSRRSARRSHPRRGASDRAGNELRRGREADDHPERRHAD
jgi:hypothetical protein